MPYYAYQGGSCAYPGCSHEIGLVEVAGGRQKLYCSDVCRKKAHYEAQKRLKRMQELRYNSELRELWQEFQIEGKLLDALQEMLLKYGKVVAMDATQTVILAQKLMGKRWS
jgi:hypothetical protein